MANERHEALMMVNELARTTSSPPPTASELQQLELAISRTFESPVTAFLTRVQIIAGWCFGVCHRHVKSDPNGQFNDGHRILTSEIRQSLRCEPFWCVRTDSGSFYVIVTLSDDSVEIPDLIEAFGNSY